MKSKVIYLLGLFLLPSLLFSQKVIKLYSGPAPGSEDWNIQETEFELPPFNQLFVANVSSPSLFAYLPDSAKANGVSVIICPGGGFHMLGINHEGVEVAKWLTSLGIAAFVLKYRVAQTGENTVQILRGKMQSWRSGEPLAQEDIEVIKMGTSDALASIKHVRENTSQFNVSSNKIGLMGFSAGGAITALAAFDENPENRPNFIAPIYGWHDQLPKLEVPDGAPPLFIVAATDDDVSVIPSNISLYNKWFAAGISAEMHIYSSGGHGFGMIKQNLPIDQWKDRFFEWLQAQKFVE